MNRPYRNHYHNHPGRYRGYHRATTADPEFFGFIATIMLVFGAIAAIVIAAVTVAGGFDAAADDPHFPKPDGYAFQNWRLQQSISLCVDPDGAPATVRPLIDIARDAVGGWQYASGGKLPLVIDGLCPGRGLRHGDGQSVVGWGDLDRAIGQANVRTNSLNEVTEADVTIRPLSFRNDCMLSIVLHEVGHVAGMAHQNADASSVMTPSVPCGTSLSWSDMAAARYQYH